jgi:hypothetical protein
MRNGVKVRWIDAALKGELVERANNHLLVLGDHLHAAQAANVGQTGRHKPVHGNRVFVNRNL